MKERIEALEREVMELRVQLRVLNKELDRINEGPADSYMPLWDGRDGQIGQELTVAMRLWRRFRRELQAMEDEFATIKDKGSDEALHLAKRLEVHREATQELGQGLNREAKDLLDANFTANIKASHEWLALDFRRIGEDLEIRIESCIAPNCHARRTLLWKRVDGQFRKRMVAHTVPTPMVNCPWNDVEQGAQDTTHQASGEEDIPF